MPYLRKMAGIYIHIPFCSQACHYCDFHFSTSRNYYSQIINAIESELVTRCDELNESIETIYFGGGTPSLLSIEDVKSILATIDVHYNATAVREITFEINPENSSIEYLKGLRSLGVNRLSVGIQTFNNSILKWMNRSHDEQIATACLEHIKKVGFDDFSCDLIFGSALHSMDILNKDLSILINSGASHISTYSLTVEPSTAFAKFENNGQLILPEDEEVIKQMHFIHNTLSKNEFERYEVSNYAKNHSISAHNSAYWKNRKYMGVGPSAHSYNLNSRRINLAHNKKYIDGVSSGDRYFEIEKLSSQDLVNEHILTRIRTKWGIDLSYISTIEPSYNDIKKEELELASRNGDIVIKNDHIFYTERGLDILDTITANLFL